VPVAKRDAAGISDGTLLARAGHCRRFGDHGRHDDWDTQTDSIHAGPDSLYVSVRPAAMDLVAVSVMRDGGDVDGLHLRTDLLSISSGRLMVADPEETVRLVVPVDSTA
jgi:hypothetical protein